MRHLLWVVCVFALAVAPARGLPAADKIADTLLPDSCAQGWLADGKASIYTPENLYKYIDGEAELYLPYGFEQAQTIMYFRPEDKSNGLVANVFKMGSLLDAFGIYGNYRGVGAEPAKLGAEGFIEESQVMFYQGRYFVQIMASGSITGGPLLFLACAATIAGNLAGDREAPRELAYLQVPGLVPMTERYYADSLLGYGFLGRGLTAEVMLKAVRVKAFVVLGDSDASIERVFGAYAKQLKEGKAVQQVFRDKGSFRLTAIDPLYKGVVLQQSGRFAVGVAGLADPGDDEGLVAQIVKGLPKR
jgi:hypothetical protein